MEIRELKELLNKAWTIETCSPYWRDNWSKENPYAGQCAITALIVNDYFGGKIMRCMTPIGSHYYNLVNDEIVDFTSDQFEDNVVLYDDPIERKRDYLLSNEDTKARYKKLLYNLKQVIRQKNGKKFKLIDSNGQPYLSDTPGTLGGNKANKIYGKLDCRSANSWIEKGFYVSNRVFFKDEQTAIDAGYRPCAVCMPKEYKEWKEKNNPEKNISNAVKFYLLATKLKYKIRSAWDNKHWDINSERLESIAEHVYGTCILAISLNSEAKLNLDMEKVLKMLAIHEIGEVLIGDITPFDNITDEEKQKIEHEAMKKVIGDLNEKDELFSLLIEFDEHKTKEAKFAYLCDKMEFDMQFKIYQDMGLQKELNNQENNVVFKNEKINKMLEDGAKTPFDICCEWDESKFKDEPTFNKILKYIKENNTNI